MDEKDYIMSDGDFLFNKSAVVDELKDIYTTLDGPDDVSDINSIEAMVEKVAEAAEDSGGITPTGTLSITSNGLHDVTNYASVAVSVPTPLYSSITIKNNSSYPITFYEFTKDKLSDAYYSSFGYKDITIGVGASEKCGVMVYQDSYNSNYKIDTVNRLMAKNVNHNIVIGSKTGVSNATLVNVLGTIYALYVTSSWKSFSELSNAVTITIEDAT